MLFNLKLLNCFTPHTALHAETATKHRAPGLSTLIASGIVWCYRAHSSRAAWCDATEHTHRERHRDLLQSFLQPRIGSDKQPRHNTWSRCCCCLCCREQHRHSWTASVRSRLECATLEPKIMGANIQHLQVGWAGQSGKVSGLGKVFWGGGEGVLRTQPLKCSSQPAQTDTRTNTYTNTHTDTHTHKHTHTHTDKHKHTHTHIHTHTHTHTRWQ